MRRLAWGTIAAATAREARSTCVYSQCVCRVTSFRTYLITEEGARTVLLFWSEKRSRPVWTFLGVISVSRDDISAVL